MKKWTKGLVAFLELTAPSLDPYPVDASLIRMLPCLARAVILSTVSVQWLECNQHYAGARRSTATFLTIILYFDRHPRAH